MDTLKTENQRLKDENGALIRVISKLSKWWRKNLLEWFCHYVKKSEKKYDKKMNIENALIFYEKRCSIKCNWIVSLTHTNSMYIGR
jgi:hypothetical protein